MKHLFIVNPVAGKKDRSARIRTLAAEKLGARGLDYEIYVTRAPMDACEKVRAAAAGGERLRIYACGGDGTLNECVNGAVGRDNVELTHFPTGTGNDFIKSFGADAALFFDLEALLDGEALPMDTICCNGRHGVSICSVGIDARIGGDVHKYSKIPLIGGATGYVTSLVVNICKGINQELELSVDGRPYTGPRALVCACNGSYYGGGFHPIPEAEPDDGQIDFLIVKPVSRVQFLRLVGKYAKGRYRELAETVERERGQRMELRSKELLAVNVDGEILWDRQLHMEICPASVNFVLPRGAAFLETRKRKQEKTKDILRN